MFRIVRDTSSGNIQLYLTEIRGGSLMFVEYLVGVWQRNFETVVCVCMVRRTVHTHHHEFQSSTALYSLMMVRIRSETCRSDF